VRVLITNFALATRTGAELYVRDLACALLARGHAPVAYAPKLGPLADDLRRRTIPVVDDLRAVAAPPDIIHGQHNHEMMTALLRFPGVPAVRVCHGFFDAKPHQFPRIARYVAVDDTVRDRMISEWGISPDRVAVCYNFADLASFSPRAPLPARPQKAAVFSNAAAEHLAAIRRACAGVGVAVDAIGEDVRNIATDPGAVLRRYDIVFAKARCAIEAMAVGAAVILCDRAGLGPMVDSGNFEALRRRNFGVRTLSNRVTVDAIREQLGKYEPADAGRVSERMRAVGSLEAAADAMVALYEEAIAARGADSVSTAEEEFRSAAEYLQTIAGRPGVKAAATALCRAVYFHCEGGRWLRHFVPSRTWAHRIGEMLRPASVSPRSAGPTGSPS